MDLDEKHYEFVCSQVRFFVERANSSFEFFIKLYSAILGGTIWLSLQPGITQLKAEKFVIISNALVIGVTALSTYKVWDNVRAWRGYRWAQVRMTGLDEDGMHKTPPPKVWPAHIEQVVYSLAMATAASLYCIFNPLSPSSIDISSEATIGNKHAGAEAAVIERGTGSRYSIESK